MKKTSSALDILNHRFGNRREYRRMLEEERDRAQAARVIFEARKAAGLTQKELAERVGTTQPVIARLESADYEGHSLAMLERIAAALGLRLEVRFVAKDGCDSKRGAAEAAVRAEVAHAQ
jgi:transcriptional regulator with XRE-family HTH domain